MLKSQTPTQGSLSILKYGPVTSWTTSLFCRAAAHLLSEFREAGRNRKVEMCCARSRIWLLSSVMAEAIYRKKERVEALLVTYTAQKTERLRKQVQTANERAQRDAVSHSIQ